MIPTTSKSFVLAPYQVLPVSVRAAVFSCAVASAEFQISFDGGEYFPMQQGWTVDNRPNLFSQITFYNPTGTAITVTFYAGASAMFYSPPTTMAVIKNAPTYVKAGAYSIGAGETFDFNGLDGVKVRKQIIFTNLDDSVDLDVLDAAGSGCATVFPRSAWTVEASGKVSLKNNNGDDVTIRVAEIFYA